MTRFRWPLRSGFIDPATLLTLAVLTVTIIGSTVATRIVRFNTEDRAAAVCLDPCLSNADCGSGAYCYKPATGCPECRPYPTTRPPTATPRPTNRPRPTNPPSQCLDPCLSNADCGSGYHCYQPATGCPECRPNPTPSKTPTPKPPTATPRPPTPSPTLTRICPVATGDFYCAASCLSGDILETSYSCSSGKCCQRRTPTATPRPPTPTPTRRPTSPPSQCLDPCLTNSDCSPGYFCYKPATGCPVCQAQVCTPNQITCSQSSLRQCNSLGSSISTLRTCPHGCNQAGNDCNPAPTAVPGGQCLDPCTVDSDCGYGNYCYKPATGCPVCQAQVCTPNFISCTQGSMKQCNSTGSLLTTLRACPYGCNDQGLDCNPPPPTTSANRCLDPCQTDTDCGYGNYCYKPATGCPVCQVQPTPTPIPILKNNNELCSFPDGRECLSQNCQVVPGGLSYCMPAGTSFTTHEVKAGETCGTTSFGTYVCEAGLNCLNGICGQLKTIGDSCKSNNECLSQLCAKSYLSYGTPVILDEPKCVPSWEEQDQGVADSHRTDALTTGAAAGATSLTLIAPGAGAFAAQTYTTASLGGTASILTTVTSLPTAAYITLANNPGAQQALNYLSTAGGAIDIIQCTLTRNPEICGGTMGYGISGWSAFDDLTSLQNLPNADNPSGWGTYDEEVELALDRWLTQYNGTAYQTPYTHRSSELATADIKRNIANAERLTDKYGPIYGNGSLPTNSQPFTDLYEFQTSMLHQNPQDSVEMLKKHIYSQTSASIRVYDPQYFAYADYLRSKTSQGEYKISDIVPTVDSLIARNEIPPNIGDYSLTSDAFLLISPKNGNQIVIPSATPSQMAEALGHELGHIYDHRNKITGIESELRQVYFNAIYAKSQQDFLAIDNNLTLLEILLELQ